jgi:hypothetical protein
MAIAMRYDGSGFVRANWMVFDSPDFVSDATGVFASASYCAGIVSVSSYGILKAGSSKIGNGAARVDRLELRKRYGSPFFRVILCRPTAVRLYLFVKPIVSVRSRRDRGGDGDRVVFTGGMRRGDLGAGL